jgi:hypothetical protein
MTRGSARNPGIRIRSYFNVEEALEAAGLSE